jgi:hypothetical protein
MEGTQRGLSDNFHAVKIKIFTSAQKNEVETMVNTWLGGNRDLTIQQVLQSESTNGETWNFSITFLYTPGEKGAIGFTAAAHS